MVSKGWIHGELGRFSRCIQNLIKSDNELNWGINEINIFAKKNPQNKKSLNLN